MPWQSQGGNGGGSGGGGPWGSGSGGGGQHAKTEAVQRGLAEQRLDRLNRTVYALQLTRFSLESSASGMLITYQAQRLAREWMEKHQKVD